MIYLIIFNIFDISIIETGSTVINTFSERRTLNDMFTLNYKKYFSFIDIHFCSEYLNALIYDSILHTVYFNLYC